MPYLPDLSEGATTRQLIEIFAGYNRNMRISPGEWYNEENISSARYPLFSRRKPRKLYKDGMISPQGMIAKDALAYVDGDKLIYNGKEIDGIELSTAKEDCPKQLVSMGAYMCVFPDAVYVNTADLTDAGTMGAVYESVENAAIRYSPCRIDGTDYENVYISDTKPDNPENGQYWLDTSSSVHALKQYSSSTGAWIEIPTVYTRIAVAGIGKHFKDFDGVTISGAAIEGSESLKKQIAALNADMFIQKAAEDYIIVTALIDETVTQNAGSIKVERKIPKMDFVCEANNRLWGCYYGMRDGKVLNEIYSCKLGDFKNWNVYMGISTDSYTVSIGTDGEFTGCIAYGGYPIFFKENYVHKIYGMQPSAYQVQTSPCRGVQRGSHRSMVVVNEILYYKSRTDVCAYDGSLPVGVSAQLGDDKKYYEASAGAHGGKYYISMRDEEGAWSLFAFDTKHSIWHREDATHAGAFAAWGDALYMMDMDGKRIWDINGSSGEGDEGEVRWMAESGLIGYEMIDHKYVSRFNFRMKLGAGAECKLEIEYDSGGAWEDQGTIKGASMNSFILPVIPRRCDHFRLRLSGTGEIFIYSIAKLLEQGSDA